MIKYSISILGLLLLASCSSKKDKLPILGNRYAETRMVNGTMIIDSVYATIPPFFLYDQNNRPVSQTTVDGKIYIADFFFTTCPTICPIMKKEMLRVYEAYKGNPDIMILSHTIDPDHDSVEVLKDYSTRLGADGKQWLFLTGNRDSIYDLAEKGYYASALADSTEPGGFVHSGGFILVDKLSRVRGIYDGTNSADVSRLIGDIENLIHEK